jgi:beta-lactamase class A
VPNRSSLLCCLAVLLAGAAGPPVPLDREDPRLHLALAEALEGAGLGEALASRRLAVAVVDLSYDEPTAYAGLNADDMLYAASLPKIALLLAVVQAAHDGRRPLRPGDLLRLERMITVSDNADASWAYDSVGPSFIAEVLQRPEYALYAEPDGGLWVGRPYRPGGRENRDRLFKISHGSTARQAARFYALLAAGRLVSPYWSERMLDLMGPPGHHHKFVAALQDRPGLTFVARKSGTWTTFHSDSALIDHHGHRYILVAVADAPEAEAWLRTLAPLVDDLIMAGSHRHAS